MLEDDGVSPHTAHTTNPVPLVLTTRAVVAAATAASSPTWRRPSLELLGLADPGGDDGTSLVGRIERESLTFQRLVNCW